jgi:integrase
VARRDTGTVRTHVGKDGIARRYLRFWAGGKRRQIALGAVSLRDADRELRFVLADVARGVWQPPAAPTRFDVPETEDGEQTFHEYSEAWWLRNEPQWRPSAVADYRWRLERHLLPYFADLPLTSIRYATVEDYIATKLREGKPLSATSINMTVTLLARILESAVEAELIDRNPARGSKRRVPEPTPRRTVLDTAEGITALLDGARALDLEARARIGQRHVLLATLVFAGLRIGEALALRWQNVDLARGTLTVTAAKTNAGVREINLLPVLRDELLSYRAATIDAQDALVFGSCTGAEQSPSNIRNRVLAAAVARANERLTAQHKPPLPSGLTPHSLRRTFASILFAVGETPPYVMAQMGHTTAELTLNVYARQMARRDGEPDRLRALVYGGDMPSVSDAQPTLF